MDVKVKEAAKAVKSFPKLMIDENGNIVLFSVKGSGIVMKHSLYCTGYVFKTTQMLSFTDFDGEVTISN